MGWEYSKYEAVCRDCGRPRHRMKLVETQSTPANTRRRGLPVNIEVASFEFSAEGLLLRV
jgi:hypothetical protein